MFPPPRPTTLKVWCASTAMRPVLKSPLAEQATLCPRTLYPKKQQAPLNALSATLWVGNCPTVLMQMLILQPT